MPGLEKAGRPVKGDGDVASFTAQAGDVGPQGHPQQPHPVDFFQVRLQLFTDTHHKPPP